MAKESDLQEVQTPHVFNVLPVHKNESFFSRRHTLLFKYMQTQKKSLLDNATEVDVFFCIYVLSQIEKNPTTNM